MFHLNVYFVLLIVSIKISEYDSLAIPWIYNMF